MHVCRWRPTAYQFGFSAHLEQLQTVSRDRERTGESSGCIARAISSKRNLNKRLILTVIVKPQFEQADAF
jgi:hypothetical protein